MYYKNNMNDIKIINNRSHDINDKLSNKKSNDEGKVNSRNLIDKKSIDNSETLSDKSKGTISNSSSEKINTSASSNNEEEFIKYKLKIDPPANIKSNTASKKKTKIYNTNQFGYYSGKKLNCKNLSYIILIISVVTYYGFSYGMNFSYILFFLSLFMNKNLSLVFKSIRLNNKFYLTLSVTIIIFSIKYGIESKPSTRIISGMITIILSATIGWYVHYLSHTINYRRLYSVFLRYLSKLSNGLSDKLINSYIKDTMYFISDNLDFHSMIHHNPKLNRLWYNRIIETLQNLVSITVPVWYAAYKYQFNFSINNTQYFLNKTIPIFWGLLYATNHNINYFKIQPKVHEEHHIYDTSKNRAYHTSKQKIPNLGWPDTLDFIFDTKYKTNIVENFNHAAYNIIVLTIMIIIIKTKFNWLNKFI